MTATTEAPGLGSRQPASVHAGAKVTIPRVLRSEWTKLTSLRSTVWTLLIALVVTIGFGCLISAIWVSEWRNASPEERATDFTDPVMASLTGAYFSQIAVGVLGVLLITGEYSTGMIRTSLGAVPHRLPVLFCKAAVFGVLSFVLALSAILVAFFAGQAILNQENLGSSIGDPHVLRVLLGGAFFVMAIGLLGLALGTLIRSTGGSIAALLGLIFVVPIITSLLPGDWDKIHKYVPDGAGEALVTIGGDPERVMSPLGGLIVLLIWLVVGLGSAAYVLIRRDA
ncbi:ABC transporter permease [Frankia sp. CNm7]|uniref:ABC transporter permease n=1 Tax=Frankia nepalensis TaxID=1836974 RepID=A0A937RFR5_9ACTN|nr:ABC transporter permease [Frankia nepalensis]MBL7494735.1 ABC transporter permease [Frankia nepalensis]MBL7513997.1 ABC transporter permease [Frankia nepalensis]MBL7521154.1 ABC transporter permease [Frankia nepalensis]MBL7628165.1 ABC transporter permease [Frankia nepalensis]